jgi:hypothetical protein
MFLLHVHGLNSTNHPNSALEFVAETPSGRDNDRIQLQHLTSLGELRWVLDNGSDEIEYKQVGTVAHKASDSEVHQIIATDQSPWYKVDDLQSALGSEDFRKRLTPILRIQLASMIAITHLYFADIRVTSTEVSPVNIVYYNDSISWEDLEPFVLNPFLSIGFGSRKSRVKLGFSSGRPVQKTKTKTKNNTVAELGVLLHRLEVVQESIMGRGLKVFEKQKNMHWRVFMQWIRQWVPAMRRQYNYV